MPGTACSAPTIRRRALPSSASWLSDLDPDAVGGLGHRPEVLAAAEVDPLKANSVAGSTPQTLLYSILRQATLLAARVNPPTRQLSSHQQVTELYALTLGRSPSPQEFQEGTQLIEQHSTRELAWALLNSSEFLFLR